PDCRGLVIIDSAEGLRNVSEQLSGGEVIERQTKKKKKKKVGFQQKWRTQNGRKKMIKIHCICEDSKDIQVKNISCHLIRKCFKILDLCKCQEIFAERTTQLYKEHSELNLHESDSRTSSMMLYRMNLQTSK
ncbi:hypothetical protein H1C71_037409, partial [Ictidomys tridecemlineatus]